MLARIQWRPAIKRKLGTGASVIEGYEPGGVTPALRHGRGLMVCMTGDGEGERDVATGRIS
jgi:hypothetical protein